jgi:hypothetical protein
MGQQTRFAPAYFRSEVGASTSEYAMVLAILGLAIGGAALFLGHKLTAQASSQARPSLRAAGVSEPIKITSRTSS